MWSVQYFTFQRSGSNHWSTHAAVFHCFILAQVCVYESLIHFEFTFMKSVRTVLKFFFSCFCIWKIKYNQELFFCWITFALLSKISWLCLSGSGSWGSPFCRCTCLFFPMTVSCCLDHHRSEVSPGAQWCEPFNCLSRLLYCVDFFDG
jgi:hypothetical protein